MNAVGVRLLAGGFKEVDLAMRGGEGGSVVRRKRQAVVIVGVSLIVGMLSFATVGVPYSDPFNTAPTGNGTPTITTGSEAEGLEYSGVSFAWGLGVSGDGGSIDADAFGAAGAFTITSRNDGDFQFSSIRMRNDGTEITISGTGPQPFSITVPAGSGYATYTPIGGAKLVTQVEISSGDFWIDFDDVVVDLNVPEMAIEGNGTVIADGDTTPTSSDHTDFGLAAPGSPVSRTFTIRNNGAAGLDLTGFPYVALSGSGDFSVATQPSLDPIPAGGSDTFTIACDPSGIGPRTATVSVANNDSDQDPYTFVVQCTGADTDPPDVSSITLADADPTNAITVNFTVTFDESVTGVGIGDFTPDESGLTGASIDAVSGSGTSWNVLVVTGTGDGTLSIDLVDDDSIEDGSGNKLGGTGAGNGNYSAGLTYTIDKTPPSEPDGLSPSHGAYLGTQSPALSWNPSTDTGGSGLHTTNRYRYDVSGPDPKQNYTPNTTYNPTFSADGVYTWNVYARDNAGNNSADSVTQTFTIDTDPPGVASFERKTPIGEDTNVDMLVFLATFDEDVQNVDPADFAENGASGATIAVSQLTPSTYDVTLSGGTLASHNGVVGIDVAGSPTITDLAGNALPAGEPGTDETYTVDNDPPGVTSFERRTPIGEDTNADMLVFLATFDEDVQNVDLGDFAENGSTGATIAVSQLTPSTYDVTLSGGTLASHNGVVGIDLAGSPTITDLAGNALPAGEPGTDETYTVDNDPPGVSSVAASPTTIADGTAGTDTFDVIVVFDETMDSGVTPALVFAPNVVGGATPTLSNGDGGWSMTTVTHDTFTTTYDVADQNVDVDSVTIDVTGAADLAGNGQENYTPPVHEFDIDTLNPWISSITSTTPNEFYRAGVAIDITMYFSEDVTMTGAPKVDLDSGASDVPLGVPSGTASTNGTYTVSAGENSCDLNVSGVTIPGMPTDMVGNGMDWTKSMTTLGTDNLVDNKDIAVDTTDPEIAWVTEFPDVAQTMDGDCSLTFPIRVEISDNCGILAGDVSASLSDSGNVTSVDALTATQSGDTQVVIEGSVTVSHCSGGAATATLDIVATDRAGNSASDTDTVTVEDTTAPSVSGFNLPDTTLYVDASTCTYTVPYSATVTDNCCLDASNVSAVVELVAPYDTATLNAPAAAITNGVETPNKEVTISGSFEVSALTDDPVHVRIRINASDCNSNAMTEVSDTAVFEDGTDPTIGWNTDLPDTTQYVDPTSCTITIPVKATVTDACCIHAANVTADIQVTNATVNHTVAAAQVSQGVVDVSGDITVSALTGCPANLSIAINGTDCAGNAAAELSDVAVIRDNTIPVIHDLRVDEHVVVDSCCEAVVTFDGYVDDNCCIGPGGITITVTHPTSNATVEFVQARDVVFTQVGQNRVDFAGEIPVRCVTSCPAIVQVTVNADDCCGNSAATVSSTADPNDPNETGHVFDKTDPIPRDDPRQDMVMDESAASDPLVEVRLDKFGVYRLILRENTPARIDLIANDADNCSCADTTHPFTTCGACNGCCGTLIAHEIVSPPLHGTATIEDADGDCTGGSAIRYAPDSGYIGPDEFTYRIRDACGNVSTEIATVRIEVIPHVSMEDVFVTACAGEPTTFTVSATDLWVDSDAIEFTFEIVGGPSHGVMAGDLAALSITPASTVIVGGQPVPTLDVTETTSITLSYTSATGYTGRDAILIRFEDPFGNETTARVDIAVMACVEGEAEMPSLETAPGEILALIMPETFATVVETAWGSVMLLSLDDGTEYITSLTVVFSEAIGRYVFAVDTGPLPSGEYLLSVPLGNGQTVELTIEVGEAE